MNPQIRFARLFWAALIALSVALLPATIGAAAKLASTDMPVSMSMDSMAMDDCCPEPCDKTMNDCPFIAACILKNVSFSVTALYELSYPLTTSDVAPLPASVVLHSQSGSPPLHPPQAW